MHIFANFILLLYLTLAWCGINKLIWIVNKKSSIPFSFWWSHQTFTVPQGLGTTDEDGLSEFSFCSSGMIEYLGSLLHFVGVIFTWKLKLCFVDSQVERFACLYTSQVTNLSLYSPAKYYRPSEDFMPHEFDILSIWRDDISQEPQAVHFEEELCSF